MMTFDEAVEICKAFAPNGLLLDGLENMEGILKDMDADEDRGDWLSPSEVFAFRLVLREMRPLFV
jgi:hypothetical protein